MQRLAKNTALLILLTAFLTACAKEEPVKFEKRSAQEARIVFYSPSFVDQSPQVRVRTTRGSREEYAWWRSSGATAAFWYGSTFPGKLWRRTAESQPEKVLRQWKQLENASFELNQAGTVASSLGGIIYWRFRLEGRRNCFAINHFWTPSIGDQGGYRDWINGYFCKAEGVVLTDEDVAEMLARLDVRTGDKNPAGTRRD